MAKMKLNRDSQPQRVTVRLTMIAPNTAIAARIPFTATVHTPNSQAVEIIEVGYHSYTSTHLQDVVTNQGQLKLSLNLAESPATTPSYAEWATIGLHWASYLGTGARTAEESTFIDEWPKFLKLPPRDLEGRGVILPPDNLWLRLSSTGMTMAMVVDVAVFYRILDIDNQVALEMLQTINQLK